MIETGRLLAVEEIELGSDLAADVAAGAGTLTLEDTSDFDEPDEGASLQVQIEDEDGNTEIVAYTAVDDDDASLTLEGVTAAAWVAGARVRVYPQALERYAHVRPDEDTDAEILYARIPHALFDRLAEGIRDDSTGAGEALALADDGEEWLVADVLGTAPDMSDYDDPARWPPFGDMFPEGKISVVSSLPDLPSDDYPEPRMVFLLDPTDPDATGLYRSTGDAWTDEDVLPGLSVSRLRAGVLNAAVILANQFATAGTSISDIQIDGVANRFRIYDSTGTEVLNADGETGDITLTGAITATGLDVLGAATIRIRLDLAAGTVGQLHRGITAPANAPTVESNWDSLPVAAQEIATTFRGIAYDPAGDAAGATPTFLIANTNGSNPAPMVREYRASDMAILRGTAVFASYPGQGVARAGAHVFALEHDTRGFAVLHKFLQSDLTHVTDRDITADVTGRRAAAALGHDPDTQAGAYPDGTLLVATHTDNSTADARLRVRRYDPADLSLIETITAPNVAGNRVGQVYWSAILVQGGSWWLTKMQGGGSGVLGADHKKVHEFDPTTGAVVTIGAFPTPVDPYGLAHDGTVFRSLEQTAHLHEHTLEPGGAISVEHSWHEAANGYETGLGPARVHDHKARSRLRVATNEIPAGADRVRVYVGGALQATSPDTEIFIDAIDAGGAPHAASPFPEAGVSEWQDKSGETLMDADGRVGLWDPTTEHVTIPAGKQAKGACGAGGYNAAGASRNLSAGVTYGGASQCENVPSSITLASDGSADTGTVDGVSAANISQRGFLFQVLVGSNKPGQASRVYVTVGN